MKKEMTYDEIEALCSRFEKMEYQCGPWWPTMEEVTSRLEPSIKAKSSNALEFAIWITETADAPATPEDEAVRTYLLRLINQSVRIKNDNSMN